MPKVSIVVPIYNVKKYIKQCIDSILNQTLTDIEIICIDDGSDDGCEKILDEYSRADSRIKVVHKKNSGYGHSMNIGFDIATGEYIGIVESDDYIESDMYEKLYNKAVTTGVDLVKSSYYRVYTSRKNMLNKVYCRCPYLEQNKNGYYKLLKMETPQVVSLLGNKEMWTGIYKREFINDYNIRYNETAGASYQDVGFWGQILLYASSCAILSEAFYNYRVDNPNSSMKSTQKIGCINDEYNFIINCIQRNKSNHKNILKYIYKLWVRDSMDQIKRMDRTIIMEFLCEMRKFVDLHSENITKSISVMEDNLILFYHKLNKDIKGLEVELQEHKLKQNQIIEQLGKKQLLVYGAGICGESLMAQLADLYLYHRVEACAVTKGNINDNHRVSHIKIKEIDEYIADMENYLVIVAAKNEYLKQMISNLEKLGFEDYIAYQEILQSLYVQELYRLLALDNNKLV